MYLQSPVWCKIFGVTSSIIVTFSTKSINSTFPKPICSYKHGQENHNLDCFGGHSCPPELFQKHRQRGEPQNYIGHGVGFICPLNKIVQLYCTLEKKYQTISLKIVICILGERWMSQPFLGLENPSSPANKVFTSAFILKL